MPLRNGVGSAVGVVNAETQPHSFFPVPVVLRAGRLFRPLLFVDRHLPEHKVHPGVVQLADHTLRIGPGTAGEVKFLSGRALFGQQSVVCAVEDGKGGLVAPGLRHQHCGGAVAAAQIFKLGLHRGLTVPVVGGDPGAKGPLWGQLCRTEQAHVFPYHLFRLAGKEHRAAPGGQRNADDILLKGEFGDPVGGGIKAEPGVGPEEGSGTVGVPALETELFLHQIFHPMAFLVQTVVFFAHAVGSAVRDGYGQVCLAGPRRPGQPGRAGGQRPVQTAAFRKR